MNAGHPAASSSALSKTQSLGAVGASTLQAREHLTRGALSIVFQQLLLRTAVFQALAYAKSQMSANILSWLKALQHVDGLLLLAFLGTAIFSKHARRKHGQALMAAVAVLTAYSTAMSSHGTRDKGGGSQHQGLEDLDSLDFGELGMQQVYSASLDVQGPMFTAAPLGVLAYAALPHVPGAALLALVGTAGIPYLQARLRLLLSGWDSLSGAALVGAGLAGLCSAAGVWWLTCIVRKMVRGRTLFNRPVVLADPTTGRNKEDHVYLATTAFVDFILMPLWLLVFMFRTWLWTMTFGYLFRYPAKDKKQ
ncbi:hypothetical protein V8C86DRAFT_2518617 [Haematococcus lacustris]|nr:hypothetical protein QJQ45_013735 [Haematococcus lacustris]